MFPESATNLLLNTSAIINKYDSVAEKTGEKFNVFDILGVGSSEVRLHSALLAELLNPKGKHGLGSLFLQRFLQTLGKSYPSNTAIQRFTDLNHNQTDIVPEKWIGYINKDYTEGGYIDILISAKNGEAVIIENKICAGDQKGQLRRYYNYKKDAVLIYLTLDGKDASIVTTFNDKYPDDIIHPICIGYKNFAISWLEQCQKDAVNHPFVRETITQYIYLLRQLTHQTTNQIMKTELTEMIAKNPEFIKSAMEIWNNKDKIKQQIIRNVVEGLREPGLIPGLHFKIEENSGTLGMDDTGFGFTMDNKPYWIYFYFRGNYDNLEVGIDWAQDQEKDTDLRDKLRNHFADFTYGERLPAEDWIWGSVFKQWSITCWSEIQKVMPAEIKETTVLFFNKLLTFHS